MVSLVAISKADFVALFCESLLYGVYTTLFAIAMYHFLFRRLQTRVNMSMMGVFVLMYLISTAHIALTLKQSLKAFFEQHAADGEFSSFDTLGDPLVWIQALLEAINTMLTDGVVVWRAWVLYSRSRWFAAGALLLLCALCVSAAGVVHAQVVSPSNAPPTPAMVSEARLWSIALGISSIITNLWAASFLGYKCWRYHCRTKLCLTGAINGAPYKKIVILLVESGVIYALIWISCLAVAKTTPTGAHVLPVIVPAASGIYSSLVIVLVCFKVTQRDEISQLEESIRFNTSRTESCTTSSNLSARQQSSVDIARQGKELMPKTAPQIADTINRTELDGEWSDPAFDHKAIYEQHV